MHTSYYLSVATHGYCASINKALSLPRFGMSSKLPWKLIKFTPLPPISGKDSSPREALFAPAEASMPYARIASRARLRESRRSVAPGAGILCCNSTAVAVAARRARPHLSLARSYSRGSTPPPSRGRGCPDTKCTVGRLCPVE